MGYWKNFGALGVRLYIKLPGLWESEFLDLALCLTVW